MREKESERVEEVKAERKQTDKKEREGENAYHVSDGNSTAGNGAARGTAPYPEPVAAPDVPIRTI